MRRRKDKSYRKLLRELRELCPPLVPVRTRRRPLKDAMADTNLYCGDDGLPRYFQIVIDSRLSWAATWVLLLHECAHRLAHAHIWSDVIER